MDCGRITGRGAEPDIIGFGYGTPHVMLNDVADQKFLEIQS
jgi:hypothetical protein